MSMCAALRAAVALNNMGVSLLHRRVNRHAMQALRDAVQTMRVAISSTLPEKQEHSANAHAQIDAHLHRSCQNMAQCSLGEKKVDTGEATLFVARVSSDDDSGALVGSKSNVNVPSLIQIDHLDYEAYDSEFCSSIILNNYAMVFLSLAAGEGSDSESQNLRKQACKLLQLSHLNLRERPIDSVDPYQTVLVSVLVLRNLVQVGQECGVAESVLSSYARQLEAFEATLANFYVFNASISREYAPAA